jgi:hypothetical protein
MRTFAVLALLLIGGSVYYSGLRRVHFSGTSQDTHNTGPTLLRVGSFVLGNPLLFAAFSVLWVKQYQMAADLSDMIDDFVVPWLWLAGFFGVSFYAIRRPLGFAIAVSLGSAVAFAGILFLFVRIVLVPAYDPMF